jgi:hypothetical protein
VLRLQLYAVTSGLSSFIFNCQWEINIISDFCIYWDDHRLSFLWFNNMTKYTVWVLNVKATLNSWGTPCPVMKYNWQIFCWIPLDNIWLWNFASTFIRICGVSCYVFVCFCIRIS